MTGPAAGAMNTADVAGLVRSELTAAGIRRQRCGRGFRYFAADGTPLTDRETLARIKALVIPPAWEDTFSAKDFRTWHATVLAAVGLAVSEPAAESESARKRAVARVARHDRLRGRRAKNRGRKQSAQHPGRAARRPRRSRAPAHPPEAPA